MPGRGDGTKRDQACRDRIAVVEQGVGSIDAWVAVEPQHARHPAVDHLLLISRQVELRVGKEVEPARVIRVSVGQKEMGHRFGCDRQVFQFLLQALCAGCGFASLPTL
jgi:hypothetical protein